MSLNKFQKNLKYLRKKYRPKLNQEVFANKINKITQKREGYLSIDLMPKRYVMNGKNIGSYEQGKSMPDASVVIPAIAEFFELSLEDLLVADLERLQSSTKTINSSAVDRVKLSSRKHNSSAIIREIIATTNKEDRLNIELVDMKAAAGYLDAYDDENYIKDLARFQLPFLPKDVHYRAFEIEGDSMLPLPSGSIVICELQEKQYVKSGETYVIVSQNEGLVYKRVINEVATKGQLLLLSDNPDQRTYMPFSIPIDEVTQTWKTKAFIVNDTSVYSGDSLYGNVYEELKSLKSVLHHQMA